MTNLSESIEKRFRKTLAPSAFTQWILTRKQFRLFVLHAEGHSELWDEDLGTMVKASIQSLQHRLRSQIQLKQKEKVTSKHLNRRKKYNIAVLLDGPRRNIAQYHGWEVLAKQKGF